MRTENHPIDHEQVMAYLDGELAPGEAARVAAHLDHCADCAELATSLQHVSARLVDWRVEPARPQLTEIIREATREGEIQERLGSRSVERTGRFDVSKLFRRPWIWAPVGLAVLIMIVVVSLTNQMGSRAQLVAPRPPNDFMIAPPASAGAPADKSELIPPGSPPPPPPPVQESAAGPMIARTAALSVTVKDLSAARSSMEKTMIALQGYVTSLNLSTEKDSPRSLKAVLAVPSPQYDAALAQLRALGRVAQEQQSSEEVSAQVVDLNARLKNARDTESRLAEILRERTGKIGDVLEVEREIARVRGEIEGMEAEQKHLNRRIAFASIDLDLTEEYSAPLGGEAFGARRQMRNALVEGYHSAAAGLLTVCVFLLSVGPSFILWTLLLVWPGIWAWRRWRARVIPQSSQTL